MKESPLPFQDSEFRRDETCGKITVLETVAYTEAERMKGAESTAGADVIF